MNNKTWLLTILILNIISTSFHYTDNALFVDLYPEPEWINTSGVFVTWGVMSLIGILGYWLYNQQKYWSSYLLLGIYAGTGLSSTAHYFYGALSQFSLKMHVFIWTDAIAGSLVVGFLRTIICSLLRSSPWH